MDLWQEYHAIAGKIDAGLTEPGDYLDEIASLSSKLAVVYEQMNALAHDEARVRELGRRPGDVEGFRGVTARQALIDRRAELARQMGDELLPDAPLEAGAT